MLVCHDSEFVPWQPDFSPLDSPNWTKLISREVELCNSIEWVEWSDDPVQVQLCELCGQPGCGHEGVVRISHIGKYLIWSGLAGPPEEDLWAQQTADYIERLGPVVIPKTAWARWREAHAMLPAADTFRQTTAEHLQTAWLEELRSYSRQQNYWSLLNNFDSLDGFFDFLNRTSCACDTLSYEEVSEKLHEIADRSFGDPDSIAVGNFDRTQTVGATIEHCYLDLGGIQIAELPLLACKNGNWGLAFGRDWVHLL